MQAVLKDKKNYYTHFVPEDQPIRFPNLDGPDTDLGTQPGEHISIQSGGKMWCGYQQFVRLIADLAGSVADALFYVGDELDYIDEFLIEDRFLTYKRVHEGCWWPLDDFLSKRQLNNTAIEPHSA